MLFWYPVTVGDQYLFSCNNIAAKEQIQPVKVVLCENISNDFSATALNDIFKAMMVYYN